MKLLPDSHILLALALRQLKSDYPTIASHIAHDSVQLIASVVSLWEIAIKTRLGKLDPGMRLEDLPSFLKAGRMRILPITAAHALAQADPVLPTRDPFDRMLLAQCLVERCRLVTVDRARVGHPLAARLDGAAVSTVKSPRTRR